MQLGHLGERREVSLQHGLNLVRQRHDEARFAPQRRPAEVDHGHIRPGAGRNGSGDLGLVFLVRQDGLNDFDAGILRLEAFDDTGHAVDLAATVVLPEFDGHRRILRNRDRAERTDSEQDQRQKE